MRVVSGWRSLSKLKWAWIFSYHCSETTLWASQHLFFRFAGAPQREDDHLLSKSNTFPNMNSRIRSTNLELWHHVINESNQETTNAQIFASWRKYRKGTMLINQESKSCMKRNYWWVQEMLMHWKCLCSHSFSMDISFIILGNQLHAV